jgi:hypothetical protein
MHPLVRVNSMVVSLTVVIMYELVPISGQLPSITPRYIVDFFGQGLFLAGIGLLGTIGVYTFLFLALRLAIDQVRLIKKLALGPSYVEGTWVGFYGPEGGETYYAIDVYKQTLTTTSVHGEGYSTTTRQTRASWDSDFVRADADLIEFICEVTMFPSPSPTINGIAKFPSPPPTINAITKLRWITRPRFWKTLRNKLLRKFAAAELSGTSVNINDVTMKVRMFKFSDDTDWPSPVPLTAAANYHNSVKP